MLSADALAEALIDDPDDFGYRPLGLLTGMVVTYGRPFTTSQAYGALPARFSRFAGQPGLKRAHDRLLEHRHTLLAHTDVSPHRKVVVFPAGSLLKAPLATEARSYVDKDGIRGVRDLFKFQEERLAKASVPLLVRLQDVEGWDPDETVELDLDEDLDA